MQSKTVLGLIAFAAVTLTGCQSPVPPAMASGEDHARRTPSNEPNRHAPPVRLVLLFDNSLSEVAIMPQSNAPNRQDARKISKREWMAQFALPAVKQLLDGRGQIVLYKFDTEAKCIGPTTPENVRQFADLVKREYFDKPGARGTYFAPVVSALQDEAAEAKRDGQRLVAVVLTNGGFDDQPVVRKLADTLHGIKELDCLVMGPLTYTTAPGQIHGSYYDAITHDLGQHFEKERVLLFPEDPQIMEESARELETRVKRMGEQ